MLAPVDKHLFFSQLASTLIPPKALQYWGHEASLVLIALTQSHRLLRPGTAIRKNDTHEAHIHFLFLPPRVHRLQYTFACISEKQFIEVNARNYYWTKYHQGHSLPRVCCSFNHITQWDITAQHK